MSEWKELKLGDLGTVVTGKTPSKNNPEDWGNDTLFITPSDYGNYRKWANDSIRKLSADGAERLSNKVLPVGSILVTCIGSDMGKVVMNRKDAITNQQINSIIPNPDVVNSDFAYYLLVDLYETLRIYGGDGTAVPIVNKGDFEKIDALIPEKDEQNAIASVLSSLDDKIDLLHRQNQTLEQMAETLFRQWFVEEANDDWEVVQLQDIAEVKNGFAFSSKSYVDFSPEHLEVLKMGHIERGGGLRTDPKRDYAPREERLERYILDKGDIVMAMTDMKDNVVILGVPAMIDESDRYVLNQRVARIYLKNRDSLINEYLLYVQLKDPDFIAELQSQCY
ncbi:restriction endonuclease subunit S [Cyclobacterium xiamenense]|uniref:restriction endonuclease subunit S n=1 Tax=Cyclobacterium xiamenense TaxID=1297121 RepID=UPI0012B8D615|nr:restriction endonuclease subunit S [Cyclobacterium xiamenense]